MKTLKTSIDIAAIPEEIWLVLTNFYAYETWNPFIKDVKGDVDLGNKISVTLHPFDERVYDYVRAYDESIRNNPEHLINKKKVKLNDSSTFPVKVYEYNKNKLLGWKRNSLFLGSYQHTFRLIPIDDKITRFENEVSMGGFLISLGWNAYIKHFYNGGLNIMNQALKLKTESNDFYYDDALFEERQ